MCVWQFSVRFLKGHSRTDSHAIQRMNSVIKLVGRRCSYELLSSRLAVRRALQQHVDSACKC